MAAAGGASDEFEMSNITATFNLARLREAKGEFGEAESKYKVRRDVVMTWS